MGRKIAKISHRALAACVFALILLTMPGGAAKPKAKGPTNDDCLACHQDASLTHEMKGKQVSLAVDPEKFRNSVHGSMFTCVDCHDDLKEAPHSTTPQKVSCVKCHA